MTAGSGGWARPGFCPYYGDGGEAIDIAYFLPPPLVGLGREERTKAGGGVETGVETTGRWYYTKSR